MTGLTILGSTGSVGVSTLDVVARHRSDYRVVALTANTRVEPLLQQCLQFEPDWAVMVDEDAATRLQQSLREHGSTTTVLSGLDGLQRVASLPDVDAVMAAIVGAAGLLPTLAAARAGKRVLLANKEALVMSGAVFMTAVQQNGALLLPIDSEHNAIFQCMPDDAQGRRLDEKGIAQILLTGSGGPFRTRSLADLENITPDEACAHPNWDMGRKISVDSATMMNKGLEIIEACWLFNTDVQHIEVVVHPQSVVHSMVQYNDGSVLAQLGNPDMRTPIAHALAWPNRIDAGVPALDLFDIARLDFERPDFERFACLRLAREAMQTGGTATAILNAANEIAVAAFLDERLPFTAIPGVIEQTLERVTIQPAEALDTILDADQSARTVAAELAGGFRH